MKNGQIDREKTTPVKRFAVSENLLTNKIPEDMEVTSDNRNLVGRACFFCVGAPLEIVLSSLFIPKRGTIVHVLDALKII